MSRKTLAVVMLVVLAGLLLAALPASAQSVTYVSYVVQPNDSLSKIAMQYCTTWQEIYNLNYAVIGSNPNILTPGTVLVVPNRCGTGSVPPGCTVYDHGPSMYAQGYVQGNIYTVAYGDTWYSVGVRFGLPYQTIQQANGYAETSPLYAGTQLIIPGLCGSSSTPPPVATPPPASTTCSITIYPSKTVYAQPDYNSTLIGVTQPNSTYPVNGAWVQGPSGSRWYPIAGFEAPGYVNVYSGEYMLSSNCPG
ncbi:MAG: LysM peptidoglycan-binding domain-containing protein [Anaerolineae bacterium]|nr:LysM peptidoglycan-binding domain-containing protein [Anaerolineae bacterium]